MYFTGDRAPLPPRRTLEFLGRADTQVKIRGHRIELAEVATAAHGLPGVRTAVADVLGERPDQQRLALFLVCDPGVVRDSAERAALAEKAAERARDTLPPYMVPTEIVPLGELPVTANGKVDRAALRRLAGAAAPASPDGDGGPPRPGTETLLAGVWESVLGVPVPGRDADFFRLGGTSLLAARMVGRIESACGVRPVLSGLFRHPTLAGQARLVDEERTDEPRCTAVLRQEPGAPRLVLFHPVGGGLLCYRDVVDALPGPRHVVGVQSPADAVEHGDGTDGVTAFATRYADELIAELAPVKRCSGAGRWAACSPWKPPACCAAAPSRSPPSSPWTASSRPTPATTSTPARKPPAPSSPTCTAAHRRLAPTAYHRNWTPRTAPTCATTEHC